MTKDESQTPLSFQHLVNVFLSSADAPFIPFHRTGFSGASFNKTLVPLHSPSPLTGEGWGEGVSGIIASQKS